jgi:hypothetical protein
MSNPSKVLAFQVAAEAYDESDELIPMVLWNENYIQLMPGETVVLSAAIPKAYSGGAIRVRLSGWNIARWERTLQRAQKASVR